MGQKDAFTIPGINDHLQVIISNPDEFPDEVICFNLTTWKGDHCDSACIVEPGEHTWVRRKSFVYYENPLLLNAEAMATLETSNLVEKYPAVSEELFVRMLNGAQESTRLPVEYEDLMFTQALLT